MSKRTVALFMLLLIMAGSALAHAQQAPNAQGETDQQAPAAETPQRLAPAQQIEQDLNQMESLLNNMAAETAFIKDTNLSILLGTNYRMWSILLRDMRLQMALQKKADSRTPTQ